MRYEILGAKITISEGGERRYLIQRKVRVVLAALLINRSSVVSKDQLIDEIWVGTDSPRTAVPGVHVAISHLRKMLSQGERRSSRLITSSPGYLLRLEPGDELDVLEFKRLLVEGRNHAREGRHKKAIDTLRAALLLGEGTALADLAAGPIVNGFVAWLGEARLECHEIIVDSSLRMGRYREVVSLLQQLIAENRHHEAFYRLLMLALVHSGRRVDALRTYQLAYDRLTSEMGLEPGSDLKRIQQAVLQGHGLPDLALPEPARRA
jgi:DNA-binding SARP family transcriptional activator